MIPVGYKVERLSLADARPFFVRNHYCHGCGNAPAAIYGLRDGRCLIGALMFQRPGSEATCAQVFGVGAKLAVTGLHRLCILDVTPRNTESWFIARCLRLLKEDRPQFKAVLTFADPSAGHVGTIYQASNARYYGTGKREKRFTAGDGSRRSRRQCGVNLSDAEAEARGWTVAFDPPKHRYCLLVPEDASERRVLQTELRLAAAPYPKHDVTCNGATA